jgi:hypothetical protein
MWQVCSHRPKFSYYPPRPWYVTVQQPQIAICWPCISFHCKAKPPAPAVSHRYPNRSGHPFDAIIKCSAPRVYNPIHQVYLRGDMGLAAGPTKVTKQHI